MVLDLRKVYIKSMSVCKEKIWVQFLEFMQKQCSSSEFENWLSPIEVVEESADGITLQVPNIFMQEYLLDNYKKELCAFLPLRKDGSLAVNFVVKEPKKNLLSQIKTISTKKVPSDLNLNPHYNFENFIEGPSNQFVKSAALGVAKRPGKTFNPLFIHGGVGLGKTHLLHSIGIYIRENHKLSLQLITTEAFINELVNSLRNKSIGTLKRYYRNLDVLLLDDIQLLQNKIGFEEEFCNTFESLINRGKQIIITSDKPPSQLQLSERIIARMEWGLVAHINIPELETRVAIIQHKARQRGFEIPSKVAFFIADHVYNNVRQIEGAINRLNAYCRLMNVNITEELAENLLKEIFEYQPTYKITTETILKNVATVFNVKVSDIKGNSRLKNIALARQVAMFLAKEMIKESLTKIASSFGGKTHSTLIHAHNKIAKEKEKDPILKRQLDMIKKSILL